MLNRSLLVTATLVLALLAASLATAQEIQRGRLVKLDVQSRTAVVTIDGIDHELTLTDDTRVPWGQGRDLAERFRPFKLGSDVVFKTTERAGRKIVQIIGPGEPSMGAQDHAGSGRNGPQRGKVKRVDLAGRTITLTVGGKDIALAVTEQSEIHGAQGGALTDRLRVLAPGSDVMFLAAEHEGRTVLRILAPVGAAGNPTGAPRPPGQAHAFDLAALTPLNDLGAGNYRGYGGGLYPEGQNTRPAEHEAAGRRLAAAIQPLNAEGRPDPAGTIVLLSIGMSNASQASQGFERALAGNNRKNPRLLFINGAQDSMIAAAIRNPEDGGRGTQYWNIVDQRIERAGATRAQVQAIWIKEANFGPQAPFPAYPRELQSDLMQIVQILPRRFPNAKLAYLSSRSYAGDANSPINPEPFAYESAFAVKWLIEEQIKHDPALNYDPSRGVVRSPWLSWGPYFWANGQRKRATDGFIWERDWHAPDGTHLSAAGQAKVGQLLIDFFMTDPTTRAWFNRRQAGGISSSENTHQTLRTAGGRW